MQCTCSAYCTASWIWRLKNACSLLRSPPLDATLVMFGNTSCMYAAYSCYQLSEHQACALCTSQPKLMLSSAPKSRCLSSWRLAHPSFSKRLVFSPSLSRSRNYLVLLPSSKQLYTHAPFLSSLSLFHVLCVFVSLIPSLILYNPTHAGSLTQTKKDPYKAFGETLFSGLSPGPRIFDIAFQPRKRLLLSASGCTISRSRYL